MDFKIRPHPGVTWHMNTSFAILQDGCLHGWDSEKH